MKRSTMWEQKNLVYFLSLVMISILLLTPITAAFAANESPVLTPAAAAVEEMNAADEIMSQIKTIIGDAIVVNAKGIEIKNKNNIIKKLKFVDLDALEKHAASQGIVFEGGLTEEKVLNAFTQGIDSLNRSIANGELKVLAKGTIVKADDDGFYLQGGSTYDAGYWWGIKRYKSTTAAKQWVFELNSAGNVGTGAALIYAVFGYAPGAIITGLTALWCYQLANSVTYRNGLNDRGIVASITWLLVYTVNNQ